MTTPKQTDPLWIYPSENPIWLSKIVTEFNIHPVTAQILVSRNFCSLEEIHNFLYGKLPSLYDPSLFRDLDKAIARIIKALQTHEGILIYGDNDVDGMTATALLTEFFKELGANIHFFIPNSNVRKKGIIADGLDYAKKHKCSLLITVDCGITAAKEIEHVVKHNVDVIITDHHEPTSKIPNCIATLNPKLEDSTYPNRDITGVGVAFKLAHAVLNHLIENSQIPPNKIDLKHFLDFVALGTISDMGALRGENRILVRYGLKELNNTQRIGLRKLYYLCDVANKKLTPIDVAAKIAPRLNSLGRIAEARKGVELLLMKDEQKVTKLAKELELYNIERQKIERIASEEIDRYIRKHPEILNEKAIVLYSDKWHPGIIPIISAKLTKQYNRPTLLIAIEDNLGKGSIRTIPEFPLLKVLKNSEHLLVNFGGHDYAAGLTINRKDIPELKKAFITHANKTLKDPDVVSKLYLDAHTNFDKLTFDFMESLNLLEPFGNENPAPILYCDATQAWAPKVVGKSHLKFYLQQKDRLLEGIGFGMANHRRKLLKKDLKLRIAFTPHINTFLNKTSIQLQIRDFKILNE